MRYILLSVLLSTNVVFGQVTTSTWGISDTELTITKTTDFGTVHDYLELFNYSGTDLEMRWILKVPPAWPTEWDASFTDPDNYYPDVLIMDSADFTLLNPVGFSNKLIIGVNHYSNAGISSLSFKVFPIDYPEDSLWLTYNIIINQGEAYAGLGNENTAGTVQQIGKELKFLNVKNTQNAVTIYNLSGQLVVEKNNLQNNAIIDLESLNTGVYLMNYQDNEGGEIRKKLIIN